MSGLKQLRCRIKSIKSTQKITKAMQLVSASKRKKIKNKIANMQYYFHAINKIMNHIVSSDQLQESMQEARFFNKDLPHKPYCNTQCDDINPVSMNNIVFPETYEDKSNLLIIITSERGLCGGFNSSIIKKLKHDISQLERERKHFRLLIIGQRGYNQLKNKYTRHIDHYFHHEKENNEDLAFQIRQKILAMVTASKIISCYLYFNKCKNATTHTTIVQQLFPINTLMSYDSKSIQMIDYEYQGDGLISNMLSLYILGQINEALLQSRLDEEGLRITTMENATKNAKEMIDKLTLKLNRTRQSIITTELIEIIAGAEAA
jgi:F-type H+-transporting ATPase subunit gamma